MVAEEQERERDWFKKEKVCGSAQKTIIRSLKERKGSYKNFKLHCTFSLNPEFQKWNEFLLSTPYVNVNARNYTLSDLK